MKRQRQRFLRKFRLEPRLFSKVSSRIYKRNQNRKKKILSTKTQFLWIIVYKIKFLYLLDACPLRKHQNTITRTAGVIKRRSAPRISLTVESSRTPTRMSIEISIFPSIETRDESDCFTACASLTYSNFGKAVFIRIPSSENAIPAS